MHQQNPVDAPPESRGTTRIRRTPTESCLHLQRDGSFLLKIRTYIPKLMYFHILLKDFVRNVHLEDVWANTDGAFIVYMFRRPPEVWSLVSYNALISGTGKVGITKPLEGCWYRQGNFLQQLLYHGNIVPSVYSSAIFDAPTACCGINYHINVASHVVHVV